MSEFPLRQPLLPGHYRILLDPPDDKGDETLLFVSESRRVKLKGQAFRDFHRSVMPLLDGRHTVTEIASATEDLFPRAELEDALQLLAGHGLLREGVDDGIPATPDVPGRRVPQLNVWHDLGIDPHATQAVLAASTVAVFGLAGAGAVGARALAAAGVGALRLVEAEPVGPADPYLASAYESADAGRPRADAIGERLAASFSDVRIETAIASLDDDAAVASAVGDADFVLCCLDGGRSALIYRLNRVCLARALPWIAVTTAATEVLVGPLMRPPDTACYLCYRMRLVAAAENPEDEYALQSLLDRRRRDDTASHEALASGEGVAGHLGALEVVKALCGIPTVATEGQQVVFDLLALTSTRHRVLKKPWCPACQPLDGKAASHRARGP